MPQQNTHSLPKNTFREEPPAPKPATKEKAKKPTTPKKSNSTDLQNPKISRTEKLSQVTGALALMLGFFIVFAGISFLFNWFAGAADDIFTGMDATRVVTDKSLEANNLGGRLGAALSGLLIKQGFGIGSFLIAVWLFIVGIRLTIKHRITSIGHSLFFLLIAMAWISVTLGLFFRNSSLSILAGISGYESSIFLEGLLGKMGLILLLAFVLIAFLVLAYNFSLHQIKPWIDARKGKTGKKSEVESENPETFNTENQKNVHNELPSDKYNTVEFEVKDNEKDLPSAGTATQSTTGNIPVPTAGAQNLPFEPVVVRPQPVVQNKDVEFTVENQPVSQSTKVDIEDHDDMPQAEHFGLDTSFDPKLELASFVKPGIDLLDDYGASTIIVDKEELEANKNRIVSTLANYNIQIDKIKATIGPTVTLYEIIPAPGVRISKIKNLEDDIALSLSALGIRIIAPIPGKGTIGIEVPNQKPTIVGMKSILSSERFQSNHYELPFGLGKTIANEEYVADLAKMPHILMAGATGQGKSVGLNAIITSLLYKKHPSEIKFVLIDPKKVELTLFSKIERHYLAKLPDSEEAIITDTRKVVRTLNSLNIEMDNRYDLLKDAQVRNVKEYNAKYIARKLNPLNGHRFLPYIVVVVDEFADLILTAGKEVEHPITRLAQLARAIGIHLVIATQRPSVNIITGTIKANFPARIAFRVISKIDSRTILDTGGADQLVGRGDMLLSQGGDMIRLQCAFIDTPEVERITEFIGSQRGYPSAFALPECSEEDASEPEDNFSPDDRDELFEDAAYLVVNNQQGSTSLIQRKLKLGYNRAGRIIDQLEAAGIVGPFEGSKAREVKIANSFALEQFLKDVDNKTKRDDY